MNQTLKNKCALVTGGSRGIGAAIVKRLASEGANVALTYSSSPDKGANGPDRRASPGPVGHGLPPSALCPLATRYAVHLPISLLVYSAVCFWWFMAINYLTAMFNCFLGKRRRIDLAVRLARPNLA
jgi:hypothetical protein